MPNERVWQRAGASPHPIPAGGTPANPGLAVAHLAALPAQLDCACSRFAGARLLDGDHRTLALDHRLLVLFFSRLPTMNSAISWNQTRRPMRAYQRMPWRT